jgi:hypothetical protein
VAQITSGSWTLTPGEHVCWRTESTDEFLVGHEALLAHACEHAGGLLVVTEAETGRDGGRRRGERVVTTAASSDAGATLLAVRERVRRMSLNGPVPWVLASMEELIKPDTSMGDLVAIELELAALAADANTGVVCAYQTPRWQPAVLGDIAAVHSRIVGGGSQTAGFRLRPAGVHGYVLEGSVGYESLRAFGTALRGALRRTPHLRLGCERLEVFEAAAWRVLVETVSAAPGTSVLLEGTNEIVEGAWRLSGYGATGIAVQVQP